MTHKRGDLVELVLEKCVPVSLEEGRCQKLN